MCCCFVSQTEPQFGSELNLAMVKCKFLFSIGLEPNVKTIPCFLVQSHNWLIWGKRKQLFEWLGRKDWGRISTQAQLLSLWSCHAPSLQTVLSQRHQCFVII